MPFALEVDDRRLIPEIRRTLESSGAFHRKLKIKGNLVYTSIDEESLNRILAQNGWNLPIVYKDSPSESSDSLLPSWFPKKWSVYPPMLLLSSLVPEDVPENVWASILSQCFGQHKLTHVAVNSPIPLENGANIRRIPYKIQPVYGDFGPELSPERSENPSKDDLDLAFWCSARQNGVAQFWAPRYTMFSRGNIREKTRILRTFTDIEDRDIVDLYAGIGYFALCYLSKGAKRVFCWELNPWSIEGLRKGCEANNVRYQIIREHEKWVYDPLARAYIFLESNEKACLRFQEMGLSDLELSHVNLGLLPSSKASWPIAAELVTLFSVLRSAQVHVHENVHVDELDLFCKETEAELGRLAGFSRFQHLEKIKTYAPDVWHVCVDYVVGSGQEAAESAQE